ncbi:MAG: LLM class flavin-dependent oxidoreductase, partial [Dehalococcoidia bacterium]|nr:LLM class flavin-dependent oxidoreductase [Dehalococcoidia bacterium]
GAGWFERDYDRYGFDFATRGRRIRSLGHAVPVVVERLASLTPPPLRRMPILVAGTGPTLTLPIVARHADAWHAAFPERPAELEPAVEALLRECAAIGRDPGTIEWGVGVEPDDLGRFLREDASAYLEMGFTQFTLGFNGPSWQVEDGRAWLEWRDRLNAGRVAA